MQNIDHFILFNQDISCHKKCDRQKQKQNKISYVKESLTNFLTALAFSTSTANTNLRSKRSSDQIFATP